MDIRGQGFDDRLLSGISVYQDVVIAGRVVRRGRRSCQERWQHILPVLPQSGAVFDVGSNFGWFPLACAAARPSLVVASVEADLRSAAVQRAVLESHQADRIALVTRRASPVLMRRWDGQGQRFALSLVLSVLHWMEDHEPFLRALGQISDSLVIEFPSANEPPAGHPGPRQAMADPGDYLARVLPGRSARCLGRVRSHLEQVCLRPLWWVGPSNEPKPWAPDSATGLSVEALLEADLSWPPRHWWRTHWQRLVDRESLAPPGADLAPAQAPRRSLWFTPQGLAWGAAQQRLRATSSNHWPTQWDGLPEEQLLLAAKRWQRRARQTAGNAWRRCVQRFRRMTHRAG